MVKNFCDRCDTEVSKNEMRRAEVVQKTNPFNDGTSVRVECLCPVCANQLKGILKKFIDGEVV